MALVTPLPIEQAPLLAKSFYGDGDPGPITATLAYVPELLERALPFIGAVLSPSSIGFRTKEIVILRTSALLKCRYCIDSHTPVALDSGLSTAQVRALRNEPGMSIEEAFTSPDDKALIGWVDAVATGKGAVDDSTALAFTSRYPDHHVVELTLLIATTLLLNRYASALQLPVHDSTIGRLASEGFERAA